MYVGSKLYVCIVPATEGAYKLLIRQRLVGSFALMCLFVLRVFHQPSNENSYIYRWHFFFFLYMSCIYVFLSRYMIYNVLLQLLLLLLLLLLMLLPRLREKLVAKEWKILPELGRSFTAVHRLHMISELVQAYRVSATTHRTPD